MKQIQTFFILICMGALVSGCSYFNVIRGDGDMVDEEVEIGEYDRITLQGPSVEIHYTQSDDGPFLRVKTDRNMYGMFEFTANDGELQISLKEEYKRHHLFPTEFTVTTGSKDLRYVHLTGKNKFHLADTARFRKLEVVVTGNSTFKADYLQGENLKGSVTGNGTFDLAGRVDTASFTITGNGDVNAFDLQSSRAACTVTGHGNLDIWATDDLKTVITGMGKIKYKGDPEISKDVNGFGSVKKAD